MKATIFMDYLEVVNSHYQDYYIFRLLDRNLKLQFSRISGKRDNPRFNLIEHDLEIHANLCKVNLQSDFRSYKRL